MDEAKQQITNQQAVAGQVGTNYGTVNIHGDGRRKKQRSPSPPDRFWTIPFLRNQVFTGREEVLHKLHDRLTTAKPVALTQPQVLSGLGGIGKTQVAIEYAYCYSEEYHDVLWIDAATRATLVSGFLELAVLFDLPQQQGQDQTKVIAAVKRWFISHRQWLLIFDNADDLTLAEEFLPTSTTGSIILTTRYQARRTFATKLNIETMSIQEGTLLLLRRANLLDMDTPLDQARPADRTQAESIVSAMDGLPLALDQAGAYIEETQCSLADYLERYQQKQTTLLHRRGTSGKAHPEPVATTWSLSFAQVEHQSPLAADLLRFCAFLAPDDIPEQLLRDGAAHLGSPLQAIETDPSLLDEAIGVLLHFSLVKRKRDTQTIAVHRLVQTIQKTSMDIQTQHIWAERTVQAVNQAFPDVTDYRNWSRCQLYLPHALACSDLMTYYHLVSPEGTKLLNETANYLQDQAQYQQALPLYLLALGINLNAEYPIAANANLNNLALILNDQGDYDKALPILQLLLFSNEKILGAEHPNTAQSLNNLAMLYKQQGDYAQALPLLQRALAIREKILGAEHPDTAQSLNNLAMFYYEQEDYAQALPLLQRALAIREKIQGAEHPDTATVLNNLAMLYFAQQNYTQALPLLQCALAISEKIQGAEHPDTAAVLNNLALLYKQQGDYTQALSLLQRALAISEKMLGAEHPDTATALNNLAMFYYDQEDYAQMLPLLQRALAICEKIQGAEYPATATVLDNLAMLYKQQGDYAQALPLLQRALAFYEKALGENHPSTKIVRANYAQLRRQQ